MDDKTTAIQAQKARQLVKERSGHRLKLIDLEFDAWFREHYLREAKPPGEDDSTIEWMREAWRAAYGRS